MFTVCLKKMNKITRNSFVSDFEIGPVQEYSFMLIEIILWKFIINRDYKKNLDFNVLKIIDTKRFIL